MQELLCVERKAYILSPVYSGKVMTMTTKTETAICILALLFVLSSIPIDLHIAFGLAIIFMIAIAIYKLSQVEMKERDNVY